MRPTSTRSRRTIRAASTLAAGLLLLAPAAALADDHDVAVVPDEQGEGDAGTSDDTGPDATVQQTTPVADVCSPVIVSFTPDTTTGAETAVAITAQAIDRDVEGWLRVSWSLQPGADVTAITVRDSGGTWTLIDGLDSGTLDEVQELTFCGQYDGAVDIGPEPEPETEVDPDDAAGDGDGEAATGSGSGSTQSGSGATSVPTPVPAPAPAPDADDDTAEDDLPEVVEVETNGAATDADEAADVEVAAEEPDDDVQVLGVQMTRDEADGGGNTALWVGLFALVLAGLGGGAWWFLRSDAMGGGR